MNSIKNKNIHDGVRRALERPRRLVNKNINEDLFEGIYYNASLITRSKVYDEISAILTNQVRIEVANKVNSALTK